MSRTLRILAVILLVVNGTGAIFGGWQLIDDPTGHLLQLPIDLISNTVFGNYLIPGIVLISVNGLFSLFVALASILKWNRYPNLIIVAGILLCIWLIVQIVTIDLFYPPLDIAFLAVAFALIYIGYLTGKNPAPNKKQQPVKR